MSNNKQSLQYLLKETTIDELLALFGLLYLAGLNRSNRQHLSVLWRIDGTGVEIFSTAMSLCVFMMQQHAKSGSNWTIWLQLDLFLTSLFQTVKIPNEYLITDEKLESFRGRCSFRHYIPNKLAKYGIKIYALVDAKTFYTVNFEIYPGKKPDEPFLQNNKAFDVVDRLVQPISKSNRNITFDNGFTSVPLITHLQQNHKLKFTGTLRKNKKEIPPNFITTQRKEVYSTQFAFQKDMTLITCLNGLK